MAGTIVASTLSDGTTTSSVTDAVKGSARAWVNFNGVTTATIRASYNVSSVTRNGTGDYTLNFTNSLADANYSAIASVSPTAVLTVTLVPWALTSLATNNCRLRVGSGLSGNMGTSWSSFPVDAELITVAVFR